jgi:hypothetical protein
MLARMKTEAPGQCKRPVRETDLNLCADRPEPAAQNRLYFTMA